MHHQFNNYGDFAKLVNFAYWWICIRKVLRSTGLPRLVNRPSVAGAVLQKPPSLIKSVGRWSFSSRSSKHHNSQMVRARELKFWDNFHPPACRTTYCILKSSSMTFKWFSSQTGWLFNLYSKLPSWRFNIYFKIPPWLFYVYFNLTAWLFHVYINQATWLFNVFSNIPAKLIFFLL